MPVPQTFKGFEAFLGQIADKAYELIQKKNENPNLDIKTPLKNFIASSTESFARKHNLVIDDSQSDFDLEIAEGLLDDVRAQQRPSLRPSVDMNMNRQLEQENRPTSSSFKEHKKLNAEGARSRLDNIRSNRDQSPDNDGILPTFAADRQSSDNQARNEFKKRMAPKIAPKFEKRFSPRPQGM